MNSNPSRVYLSFGRHGRYGRDTAIDRLSMLEAFLTGRQLCADLPICETLYFSPIARAVQTARFRALGLHCSHLIQTDFLAEDVPTFTIRKFINQLPSHTNGATRHYHFVTHLPVVEKLGLPELGAGEICICSAADWQEMLAENFEIHICHNPLPTQTFELLHTLNLSENSFEASTADDIYSLLATQARSC